MENEYQEAKDRINTWRHCFPETKLERQRLDEAFDTLQELIDNYSKLESIYNKYLSIQKECDNWYKTVNSYKNKNYKLEKALDMACKDCEALDEGLSYETSCDNFKVDSWEVRKKRYLEESEDNSNGN